MRQRIALMVLLLAMVGGSFGSLFPAAPSPFSPDECAGRREQLMATAGEGLIVLFGETSPRPGARFRQDNDFYYLTGCNDGEAALVMLAASGEAHLFLPEQSAHEIMIEGGNLLTEDGAAARLKLKSIAGLSALDEFWRASSRRSAP